MAALRKPIPSRMTLDEFLDWDPDDGTGAPYQLIDGEPVAMAPARHHHAAIMTEIAALVRNHLLDRGSPCRILGRPGIVPRVRANRNFRIPDLGVTCAPPDNALMVPDPVLLIEILSPSNEAETRSNIWTYTTIPSVREIVAVRSTRMEAELLRRGADGNWPEEPEIVTGHATLTLASIDYSTVLSAFYRTTGLAA
jgi:Uma2 family endonuclease